MTEEKKRHRGWKIASWLLGGLLGIAVLLPLSLYIPWVQNKVKDIACRWASEKTGMDISVGRILVKFPLDISVDDVLIIDSNRDTMLQAENVTADVAFKPLLDKRVEVDDAQLTNGRYRMVTEDSSMVLNTQVQHAQFRGVGVDLKHNEVNVIDGSLRGGDVTLSYLPHKVVHEPDTTQSEPWHIRAHTLTLDDVNYKMDMLPTIDNMEAYIDHAVLKGGAVDTGKKTVDARSLELDSADVRYVYPSEKFAKEYSREHPIPPDTLPKNPNDSIPWTVKADSLRITGGHAVYAQRDAKPKGTQGLDMNYIEVSDLDVEVNDFYNRGTNTVVPVKQLRAKERSGLQVTEGNGTVTVDDLGVDLDKMHIKTPMSDINLDGHIDQKMLEGKNDGYMNVTTDSKIAVQDVAKAVPSLAPTLKDIPSSHPIAIKGSVSGNTQQVNMKNLTLDMPRYAHATVSGRITNPMDTERMDADLDIDGRFDNINWVKPTLMDKALQKQVNLPPMDLKGKVRYSRGTVNADATLRTQGGSMAARGSYNTRTEEYDVDARFNNFPVRAILPRSDTDRLTAHVRASGKGFDFNNPNTAVNAQVDLDGVRLGKNQIKGLRADLTLKNGQADGHVTSTNPDLKLDADVTARISGDHYVINAQGVADNVDLKALKYYDGEGDCRGSTRFNVSADVDLNKKEYDAEVSLTDLNWRLGNETLVADNANATLQSDPQSGTSATLDNEDNHIRFTSDRHIEQLVEDLSHLADVGNQQWKDRSIDIDPLRQAMPHFDMSVDMGPDGVVQRYLQNFDIDFRSVKLDMTNDSTFYLDGKAQGLTVGERNVDTLTLHANELDGKYLAFKAHMGNRRGTWDDMAQVTVEGGIKGSTVDFLLRQQNIKKEAGYRLGCNATLTDTVINTRFFPGDPIIGYRKWTVNEGNFVNYNYHNRMFDANLDLHSGDSGIKLVTNRQSGATTEDIKLDIDNLKIEEWTQLVPSLKDTKGSLNADLDLAFDGKNIEGEGAVDIKDFVYQGHNEGDVKLNTRFNVDPETASTHLGAEMLIDGGKVAVAYGSLNDSTAQSPLNLNIKLERFPLGKADPFLPGDGMVHLKGYANGNLTLRGTGDKPVLRGKVAGDSAYVTLPRYGAELRLGNDSIVVDDSYITLNDMRLYGLNDNPVVINGDVDFRDLDNMGINLRMHGDNVQVIGTEQKPWSQVFGKAFVDIDGTVRSSGGNTVTRADVTLLPTSNITYVMQDEVTELGNKVDENMVTFINMKDSVADETIIKTAAAKTSSSVTANINVNQGAKIGVYLSEDGKNRAIVDGSGLLKYSIDFTGKDRLNGTYTIESGNVRYTPPIVSQKNFDIASGSTIQWSGDMLNPQLNLTATEKDRASVTGDDGKGRLVDFIVTARLGGTLSNMKLDFDLEAENDMTVQNELQSMSDVQRSQTAINLLLYGTYSGSNTAGALGNLSSVSASGALLQFLQSQLNTWAGKAVPGLDISFGINQFEGRRTGGTETSYSYRLAKNLFNDRFKIAVGGEYSTEASAEQNFSQNLISDISLEYMLNDAGSRYVRAFRHTGYESMLEGRVTKTGVGFVMKHKLNSIDDLFRKSMSKTVTQPRDTSATSADSAAHQ